MKEDRTIEEKKRMVKECIRQAREASLMISECQDEVEEHIAVLKKLPHNPKVDLDELCTEHSAVFDGVKSSLHTAHDNLRELFGLPAAVTEFSESDSEGDFAADDTVGHELGPDEEAMPEEGSEAGGRKEGADDGAPAAAREEEETDDENADGQD